MEDDKLDTAAAAAGTQDRPPADVAGALNVPTFSPGRRCRRDAFRVASCRAQGCGEGACSIAESGMEATSGCLLLLGRGGVEATNSAWVAEERNRVSGQELSDAAAAVHAGPVRAAEDKELAAWRHLGVLPPMKGGGPR